MFAHDLEMTYYNLQWELEARQQEGDTEKLDEAMDVINFT